MNKLAQIIKKILFYVSPPETLLFLLLATLFWGAQAVLAGFVIVKVIHKFNG